ncbi:MAG: hypothetical protein MIO92_06585, partial [Methanosarcinaceae archaeon]|nr:hypothetical protein [Methanosarcinaceae archaeon]
QYFEEVWVRTSDIRSDEFANLEGAPKEREANPMLGMHGIRESLKHVKLLEAEIKAIAEIAKNKNIKSKSVGLYKNNMDIVTMVINTRAAEGVADPSSDKAKYGHYIAIQLVRRNRGAANENVVTYYADSLSRGLSRVDLIRSLLQALTPAA